MLNMRDLSRVYRTETVETTALDASISTSPTAIRGVWARPGCGKSTLLNVVGMLDSTDQRVLRLQRPGSGPGLSRAKLAEVRKEKYRLHLPELQSVDELPVRENVELAVLDHNVAASERRQRADAVMDKVGIAHRAKHRPSQLSGGQQQRVAVARALVGNPKLILADEPTGNLDTSHGEEVMKMLQALNREGSTIVMVTHSPGHADYASRVVNMLDGRILQERRRAA
jgi:putative ABC transport system ATP-binding protein